MPSQQEVYERHADMYDLLIRCEDCQGNLPKAIEEILPTAGLDIIDLGAGTGRLERLLAPCARSLRAFDSSGHMLKVAETSLRSMGLKNWQVQVADHRQLPAADASADGVETEILPEFTGVWWLKP